MNLQPPIFKPQVACPSCGELSSIDYCAENHLYIWWCNNSSCGKQYSFTINGDWSVYSKPTGLVITRTAVTLEILPQVLPILVTVKGYNYSDNSKKENLNNDIYFYNQGTCPANLFRDCLEVSIGDDYDPHGLFKHVKTTTVDEFVEEDS